MLKKKLVTLCFALAGAAVFALSGCAGMDSEQVTAIMNAVQDVNDAAATTMAAFTPGAVPVQDTRNVADAKDAKNISGEETEIQTADAADEEVTRGWYDYGYNYVSLGYDTDGLVDFCINNYSDYEIVYAYISPGNYPNVQTDILPGTLPAGRSYEYRRTINSYYWDEADWYLYLVDADGDTSKIYDVFNPWSLSYVDVEWDSYNGGYTCEFGYYEYGDYYDYGPGVG